MVCGVLVVLEMLLLHEGFVGGAADIIDIIDRIDSGGVLRGSHPLGLGGGGGMNPPRCGRGESGRI